MVSDLKASGIVGSSDPKDSTVKRVKDCPKEHMLRGGLTIYMVKLTKYCTSSTLLMVKRFWASNGVFWLCPKITQVSLL